MRICFDNTESNDDVIASQIDAAMVKVVQEARLKLSSLKKEIESWPLHKITFIADRQEPGILIEHIDNKFLLQRIMDAINTIDFEKLLKTTDKISIEVR